MLEHMATSTQTSSTSTSTKYYITAINDTEIDNLALDVCV